MAERWLAIDPGVATGWSKWGLPDAGPLQRVDYGVIRGGAQGVYEHEAHLLHDVDLVVCERFQLDARTQVPDLEPKVVEGVLIAVAGARSIPIVWQGKDRKAAIADSLLKQRDLWLTGKDVDWSDGRDVNDSQIHALAYALFENHDPTVRWLYPPRRG